MMRVNRCILAAFSLAATAWSTVSNAQGTSKGNMQVRIKITQECLVNAGAGATGGGNAVLDFGSKGVLNTNTDGQTAASGVGSIQVQCSSGTAYRIGLDAGLHPRTASDVGTRRMANVDGTAFVAYQLYQDAGRVTVWGDTAGNTKSATANGNVQSHQVFGRVPPQTTPPPSTYADTVAITVTY